MRYGDEVSKLYIISIFFFFAFDSVKKFLVAFASVISFSFATFGHFSVTFSFSCANHKLIQIMKKYINFKNIWKQLGINCKECCIFYVLIASHIHTTYSYKKDILYFFSPCSGKAIFLLLYLKLEAIFIIAFHSKETSHSFSTI